MRNIIGTVICSFMVVVPVGCGTMALSGSSRGQERMLPASVILAASAQGDASAIIQKRLDSAAAEGGKVDLGAGRFRIEKPLRIPEGVTLAGIWEAPHHAQIERGTVLEVYADKGHEEGSPLITLEPSSAVRGITFFYPEQRVPEVIPYPWTILGKGMHGSVIDCTFVNAYKAINFGAVPNELHYIRNCFGCPLRAGIFIDQCTDIGRIENVHFNPHYWARAGAAYSPSWPDLAKYLFENLVAFEFARTDWEYVQNTFCYGAKAGYRFIKGNPVGANGNFLGIGADWCHRALLVESSQKPGLLITNGEFVGGEGAEAMMEITADHAGVVQLSNCSFWGPTPSVAILAGTGSASFSQCNFENWYPKAPDPYTIEARGGHLSIQNCRFGVARRDIRLAPGVASAIILGNWFFEGLQIDNGTKGTVQEGFNVVGSRPAP